MSTLALETDSRPPVCPICRRRLGEDRPAVISFTGVVDGQSRRTAQTVVTGAATALIIAVALPLWRPLLVAAVLAGALSPPYEAPVRRPGGRGSPGPPFGPGCTGLLILFSIAPLALIRR